MRKISSILLIVVLALSVSSASKLNRFQFANSLDFERRIDTIHSKVVDLTDIFALHHIKEFNEIYLAPLKFKGPVIEYLQRSKSLENKIIAICAMTKLPLDEYIKILNCYFILYSQNKINEQLLNRCIFNEFDTDYIIAKQYRNLSVRKLLNNMLACKTLSKEFKISVKETLNGKWYNDLRKTGHL